MSDPERTRWYAVHVTNRATSARGTPWVWSRPFAEAAEASEELRRHDQAGDLVIGFVVRFRGGRKEIMHSRVEPPSARKPVQRCLELLEMLATSPE